MSVAAVRIVCDIPGCRAWHQAFKPTIDAARASAAARNGWEYRDGIDICGPCGRGDTPDQRPA